jgi:hypothetical protein
MKSINEYLTEINADDIPEHPLHPGNNLMAGRVRRLIQINHTGANVGFEVAFEWGAATWDGCEMAGPDENCKRRIVSFRKGKKYLLHIWRAALPSSGESRTLIIVFQ